MFDPGDAQLSTFVFAESGVDIHIQKMMLVRKEQC